MPPPSTGSSPSSSDQTFKSALKVLLLPVGVVGVGQAAAEAAGRTEAEGGAAEAGGLLLLLPSAALLLGGRRREAEGRREPGDLIGAAGFQIQLKYQFFTDACFSDSDIA